LGISKKRSLAFNIDTSYSEEKQLEELRKYAKGFSDKGRFSDAASVYKYIVQHLNGTEEDGKTYIDLQNKITI
jgi:hypothetical protein